MAPSGRQRQPWPSVSRASPSNLPRWRRNWGPPVRADIAARLSIGVLPSVGAYLMPIANRRLHRLYPELRLVVQEGATRQLLDMLRDGHLDAVIGAPTNEPGFDSVPLFEETLWICTASDDALSAEQGPVTLADLAERPLLSLSAGFSLTDLVERLAAGGDGSQRRRAALALRAGRSRPRPRVHRPALGPPRRDPRHRAPLEAFLARERRFPMPRRRPDCCEERDPRRPR